MKFKLILILFFGFYNTLTSMSLASIKIDSNSNEINLSNQVEIAIAPLDFNISNFEKLDFIPSDKNSLEIGYSNYPTVISFDLENISNQELVHYLYINSINGSLNLYKVNKETKEVSFMGLGGTDTPLPKRLSKDIFGAIPVTIAKNEQYRYILVIKSLHNLNGKLILSNAKILQETIITKVSFLDFYSGGIILLIIYNFFIYLFLREKIYLYYSLYAGSFALTILVVLGKADMFIELNNFTFSHYLICFSSSALFFANLFTFNFLEIKKNNPKLSNFYYSIFFLTAFIFIAGLNPLFNQQATFFGILIDITIFFSILFYLYSAFKILNKSSSARFYLFSWTFIFLSVIVWFGMTFGLLKINTYTLNSLAIGNMLEMLLLSFALAYKIQILNNEKIEASALLKDKDKYIRLVRVLLHDVANSLTIVISNSKRLANSKSEIQESKLQANKILIGSENIKNLITLVGAQESHFKNNKYISMTQVNILECINISALIYEDELILKNIKLRINVNNNINIKADQTCFINNIINNLLSNSIKFSFQDSEIIISAVKTPTLIIISIQDHGCGIRDELIHDIFFTNKVITTSGIGLNKGNGLGTNLVREYMFLFNGLIEVNSQIKNTHSATHGTTIKLIFPVHS